MRSDKRFTQELLITPGLTASAAAGPLIGRGAEVASLCARLVDPDVRLVTLCGVGGVGKTRLAVEVARAAQTAFADGVRVVELAPIREPELVASAVLAAVRPGVSTVERSVDEALRLVLGPLDLLLVLDNFEQVMDAAPLVSQLLAACPALTILATSRAPLHLSLEHQVTVAPLALPTLAGDVRSERLLACPSVALLVECMRRAGVEAPETAHELTTLAHICRRLDGIPLAIELVAARTRLLSPRALLARLDRPLDLLTAGYRDRPARHQALRNTFDWSYELLTEEDQRLFRHLGVFVGGCTLDSAASVCEIEADSVAYLDALGRLTDSGLVTRIAPPDGRAERLTLLEPVREYALERLRAHGEHDAARWRHASVCVELAEHAEPELNGVNDAEALARLDQDHANSLAALRWFVDHADAERALRLAASLGPFWVIRGFTREGLERLQEALAIQRIETAAETQRIPLAMGLTMTGALMYWAGTWQFAQDRYAAALDLFGDAASRWRIAALNGMGNAAIGAGDVNCAEVYLEQGRALASAMGLHRAAAGAIVSLGLIGLYREDYARARALLTECVPILRAEGDLRSAAIGMRYLALAQCYMGDVDAARTSIREALVLWRARPSVPVLPRLLETAAFVAASNHDYVRALQIAGAADRERDAAGLPPFAGRSLRELNRVLDDARRILGAERSAAAWALGRGLSIEDAIALGRRDGPMRAALPGGLTRRESEVLRLVAMGATNREIANQLCVTVATIERHLANAYTKIGARGRADATAYAITRGLLTASSD